ncbi:MAG: hypothetical protein J0M24_16275 [Verrucomicrobia bacterium]|nr:hypothetical protein [Verrucomicrobiota bacterium]
MSAAVSQLERAPAGLTAPPEVASARRDQTLAFLLLFASGAAGLAHQILWTRRLVDVLGASTDTFSKVVGAFFVGLALGSGWSALRPPRPETAWRRLVGAELAVALLGVGVLLAVPLADVLRPLPILGPGLRLLLPLLLVTPPAFAMGVVLPAMLSAIHGQRTAVGLYAINTLGGVLGIAGVIFFALPRWGLVGAGLAVCSVNAAIALTVLLWRPRSRAVPATAHARHTASAPAGSLGLAFASGFLVLSLEVVSQHQFAQVTINSHFSSAVVLSAVLLALTAGAALVGTWRLSTARLLPLALGLAAFTCLLEPILFLSVRPGLQIIAYELPPPRYFAAVGILASLTLLPVFFTSGLLFPALLRDATEPRQVAQLLAVNGLGGWLGAELTPALLLPVGGLWRTMLAAGAAYWILKQVARRSQPMAQRWIQWSAVAASALVILFLGRVSGRWPQVSPAPGERPVEVALGREGVVATVVTGNHDWRIIFNNTYTLGGSRAQANQERQAHLPLLLHGSPRSVALLGVATGSTLAGAAVHPQLGRIDAFELSPIAARFARDHFAPFNRRVFADPRVQVTIEDARWGITQHPGDYDVVIGDLFLPWRTGEGRLFTQEHFAAVRRSLTPGGLFCQWLPLFQLTRSQYDLIARTFQTEFTNAFLLRGDFYTELPIVGLCGFADGRPLSAVNWNQVAERCATLRQTGRDVTDPLVRHAEGVAMSLLGPLPPPPSGPVNTLGNALLEWSAGENIVGLKHPWFIGVPAAEYFRDVQRAGVASIPQELQAAHDSGQFFLTLEVAAKVNAPVRANLEAQLPTRLPPSLRADPAADWSAWPMRVKPFQF